MRRYGKIVVAIGVTQRDRRAAVRSEHHVRRSQTGDVNCGRSCRGCNWEECSNRQHEQHKQPCKPTFSFDFHDENLLKC
ncbi:MAG: short-chain fatty acyl-CoA regulator family protein [Oscillospiraceae bacterium]|nr:short-chain fatty acyl-CoA regulator family protein [Oscillospiraceae bacterium]